MPERDPLRRGPALPARLALTAPLMGWATSVVLATLGIALIDSLVGTASTIAAAGGLSLMSVGFLTGALAVVRRHTQIEPADVGLVSVRPAVVLAWGPVIIVPAFALAAAGFAGTPLADSLLPPEVLAAPGPALAFGAPAAVVPLDVGVIAVAIALVVLPAIAAELVIRGVVLPSLARSVGLVPGVAVATLLTPAPFALLCGGEVPQPVVGAALLGGAGLSLAYLKTGSAYPGIAALATGLGLAYGLSLGWSAAAAGVLGLAAAAAALVLTGWLAAAWSTSLRRSHYGAPARAWG